MVSHHDIPWQSGVPVSHAAAAAGRDERVGLIADQRDEQAVAFKVETNLERAEDSVTRSTRAGASGDGPPSKPAAEKSAIAPLRVPVAAIELCIAVKLGAE
jgi:hypothetical protein